MGILNTTGDLFPSPTDGSKAKTKVEYRQPVAAEKKSNALIGSNYQVVPLSTSEKSNARGYTVKGKLAKMDEGRKKESYGPGTDYKSY